ncbi:MAG TPA: hypothetical protein VKB93_13815, partial [Thermoanaerobaculia bacterium]|nr:hypothetical protein [Thermoanaerobaculia bacterium]
MAKAQQKKTAAKAKKPAAKVLKKKVVAKKPAKPAAKPAKKPAPKKTVEKVKKAVKKVVAKVVKAAKPAPKPVQKPALAPKLPAKPVAVKPPVKAAPKAPAPPPPAKPVPPAKPAPAAADKKRGRRARPRVQSSGAPVAAWLSTEKPRSASFIPAPPRAEAPSAVAAPPASSDRLIRPEDVAHPAVRTVPVRIDVEQGVGRFHVVASGEVSVRVG